MKLLNSFKNLGILLIAITIISCGDESPIPAPINLSEPVIEHPQTGLVVPIYDGANFTTFYNTSSGNKHSFQSAIEGANSDSVDFGIYGSVQYGFCFFSPNNYPSGNYYNSLLAAWPTRNKTTFKQVTSRQNNLSYFQTIQRSGQIDTIFSDAKDIVSTFSSNGIAGQGIGNLISGDMFVILNSKNKKSLVYVESSTGGWRSISMVIRVKTQK